MAAYDDRPTMDGVFRALADPGRRRLLDSLNARNGQTLRELCAEMDMARQSVSKHLAVLEEANLVTTVWRGREKLHYLNTAPITEMSERWINRYEQPRVDALTELKHVLENTPMDKPSFVYTTYIHTTPERLWEALTSAAFTQRYWSAAFETDWTPGSEMVWNLFGVRIANPEQVVLEAEPPRRLSYTWHTFTPELARAADVDEARFAAAAGEPRSKVTFELEPAGSAVKLTVIHDGFPADSTAATLVSNGWPRVLSRLKTLLETGDTFRIDG
ncbi:MAG TPA: SRPBCC domain-containing protein [Solirubrobacteraceae bacterium]|nr:SRPBCC domain-containing protein [Solirubrobacteraceae bacterium]